MMSRENKTATLSSLEAVVEMITSDTKEEFIYYYNMATHSRTGKSVWFYMYENNERARQRYWRKKEQ